jgi:hypothetical protein
MVSAEIRAKMERVPDYTRFSTVDELVASARAAAAQHPTRASLREIGRSSDGDAIPMVSIGAGSRSALLIGCPHPNEPIGAMLVQFLMEELIERGDVRGGWTWHLIPCIDPDGTRLNEGWFGGPFTVRNYARHFYRPWSQEQVEWTFPFRYKEFSWERPLPETRALMRAFRDTRPDFVYSLHNAGFGGVYYYLSQDVGAAYPALHAIPRALGLVLSLGEPEMPWAVEWAPAVYRYPSVRDAYEYHAQYAPGNAAGRIAGGGSSWDYLTSIQDSARPPLALNTELPYFQSPDITDQTPTRDTRRDVIQAGIERTREVLRAVSELLAEVSGVLPEDTRPMRAVASFVAHGYKSVESKGAWAQRSGGMSHPATVAQRADELYVGLFYNALMASMLNRAFAMSLEAQHAPVVVHAQRRLTRLLDLWLGDVEAHLRYTATPIRTLVQAQYGAMLAILDRVD